MERDNFYDEKRRTNEKFICRLAPKKHQWVKLLFEKKKSLIRRRTAKTSLAKNSVTSVKFYDQYKLIQSRVKTQSGWQEDR